MEAIQPHDIQWLSAYGVNRVARDDERYLDNLDEIAHEGRIQFVHADDGFWGNGTTYTSPVEVNATRLRIAVLANEMIMATQDFHHVFLEGIDCTGEKDGVTIAEFAMGS